MAKLRKVTDVCPLEIGMNLVSGRWKLPILWHLSHGTIRFNELQRRLGRITQHSLTRQLRELERDGLICRKAYPDAAPRVEYALSKLGQSFLPVLDALCAWGRGVGSGRSGSPTEREAPYLPQ